MRFEFIGGALCLDFANTIHNTRAKDETSREEELHTISDVLQWGREAGLLSSAGHDRLAAHYSRNSREAAAALARAITVRDLLLSIFAGIANGRSPSSQLVSELNSALAMAPGLLRVHKNSGRLEKEWASASDGLQQVLFAVLSSAADLLAGQCLDRIRECTSANCSWLFVDESRNRSRRWCDMRECGNRMKARRHYQRSKAAQ
ncbi:MAG TPA: ABATE domain-containing protein [Candidatus Angelobacter sp.]|nr:ABATE domain-containing protein [Candidatus Angelobacter sp.]